MMTLFLSFFKTFFFSICVTFLYSDFVGGRGRKGKGLYFIKGGGGRKRGMLG